MPLGLILLVIDIVCIVHAAKSGRFMPWGLIVILVPGIGALLYLLFEILPAWFGSAQGKQARQSVVNTLDPGKRYRLLTDQLEVTDTIANRVALAEECLTLGKFPEAEQHYERVLALPMGDEPIYMVGKARAQFSLGRPLDAVATLDEVRKRWPHYQSAEGHLLYARALEQGGRLDDALSEYQALAYYYPGAEARARYGLLLGRLDRRAEAQKEFNELLTQLKRAPKYVRRAQAEWIAVAEKGLRS